MNSTNPNPMPTPNREEEKHTPTPRYSLMAINNLAVLLKMALEKLNAPSEVLGAHEEGDTDAILSFLERPSGISEDMAIAIRQARIALSKTDANQVQILARLVATASHAADQEKIKALREALEKHLPALKALMALHDEDVDMDEFPDSDSIGSGQNEAGEVYDLPMTFGHLRRARKAIAALSALAQSEPQP